MSAKVSQVMTRKWITLLPEQPVAGVLELLLNQQLEGAPVVDEAGKPVGVLTQGDLLRCMACGFSGSVGDWMQAEFTSLSEDNLLDAVWKLPGELFPVCDFSGRVVGAVTRSTLSKAYCNQVEYKLKELDAILNSAHNGIVAINEKGIITTFNPAAEHLTRCSREEAIGRFLADVVVTTGLLDVVRTGEAQYSQKYQVGHRKHITNRTPIILDGEIKGAVGVFQDISEIEKFSQELSSVRELNKELQAIIDSSYDGIIVTDEAGRLLRFNEAFLRITGTSINQVLGQSMDKLIENGIFSVSVVDMVRAQGTVTTVEKTTSSGNCLLVTGNPVFDSNGEMVRVVINVRNITELNKLRQELEQAREQSERYQCELVELRTQVLKKAGIVANSPQMGKILELAWRVAQVDTTVNISGESGTGKEVIAEFIHSNSLRQSGPFIKINCGAIPENLLESELFGYEPGAFTGASKSGKPGMFELAHGGTLFLDEIGELPYSLQVKLLRVLQERELVRVGGVKPRRIDVRILTATNQDLEQKASLGQFREDLLFRLNVVPIVIPPLRERRGDIIPLVQFFREKYAKKYKMEKYFSPEVMDVFVNYNWPGNVREIENIIERLFVTVPGDWITLENIPHNMCPTVSYTEAKVLVKDIVPLKNAVFELEQQLIKKAMDRYGSTYKAAEALDVNQSTLFRKLQKINRSSETKPA